MKKKIGLILGLILIVIIVVISSYFWYIFFLDLGSDGTLSNKKNSSANLVLVDQNKVYATYTEGIDSTDTAPGYRFQVINNGIKSTDYHLKIVEIEPRQINDGCTESSLLKTSELNYQLYLNNQLIKEGNLSELNNYVLDEQTINIDIVNNYELRIWLNASATDFEGKHYHYKVDLEVNEE